jgi:ISXO2-like transposase domain/Transposase zinc-ribbon domain
LPIFDPDNLPFPRGLPEFQQIFPDDAACAAYLEAIRWPNGFVCQWCGEASEPYRFANRPTVLRCRKCQKNNRLTASTVMQDSHTPLNIWFWGAYLVATQTPGMSAVQFQRQLVLKRYETAFQILHKLRAGMVRPDRDRIGGDLDRHVELDEVWVGGESHGKGRGVHDMTLVVGAVEVRRRKPKPGSVAQIRRHGRYAGRVRLEVISDRSAKSLVGFVQSAVEPGAQIVSDAWPGFNTLTEKGYRHVPVSLRGSTELAEDYLPIIHLVFSNLKTWLRGIHHGVSPQHLQAYLNEYTFRFNRRFTPFNAFKSLLGIGGQNAGPTYEGLYSGEWQHPRCSDSLMEQIGE